MGPIAVKGLSIHRRGSPILTSLDLTIRPGERLALLGRSGSGKTSLLRVMAGLDAPTEGSVEVGGRPIKGPPDGMTMVSQGGAVYEHLDVEGNLAFSLTAKDRPQDLEARIHEAAGRFFLARMLDRSPGTLSAGQRRAVSAARAMARPDVSLVLLDDPLVGADQQLRHRVVEAIVADRDLTVVFATREAGDTLRWADRVAVLSNGGLAQVDVPMTVYRHPVSLHVAETMGELNRIPATVSSAHLQVGGSRLWLARHYRGLEQDRRVVAGVRPPDLEMAGPDTPFSQRLRGTVGKVSQIGATQRVLFGLGRQTGVAFCAEIDAGHPVAVGDRIDWSVTCLRLYDPVGGAAL